VRLAIVLDSADAVALVPFWEAALGYEHAGSVPGFEVLLPRGQDDEAPTFLLQHVDAPADGRGRVHVDVHPPLDLGVPGLVARLEAQGGRRLGGPVTHLIDVLGIWWQTMEDPEGNVLDVVADPGHPTPQVLGATGP
jgi:Glyoxalase-like domain